MILHMYVRWHHWKVMRFLNVHQCARFSLRYIHLQTHYDIQLTSWVHKKHFQHFPYKSYLITVTYLYRIVLMYVLPIKTTTCSYVVTSIMATVIQSKDMGCCHLPPKPIYHRNGARSLSTRMPYFVHSAPVIQSSWAVSKQHMMAPPFQQVMRGSIS